MTELFMTDQTEAGPALRCRLCQKRIKAVPRRASLSHAMMHVRKNEAFVVKGESADSFYVGSKPTEAKTL